jgi:phospholipid-translocating ATPase
MDGNWVKQDRSSVIEMFFRLLAVCHTCIPEVDEVSGKVTYEAESPDEAAFVVAARELGFTFYQRTQAGVSLHELDPLSGEQVDRYGFDLYFFMRFFCQISGVTLTFLFWQIL